MQKIIAVIAAVLAGCWGLAFAALGAYATFEDFHRQGATAVVFGSVFIAFGLGIVALVVYSLRFAARSRRRANADPDKPWLWSGEWNHSDFSSHPIGISIGAWLIALIWSTPTSFAAWHVLNERPSQRRAGEWAILLLILIAVYLLAAAIRSTLRVLEFGESTLHLSTLPGQIGGHLRGSLRVSRGLRATDTAHLRLTCRRLSGSGNTSSTWTVWEDQQDGVHIREAESKSGIEIPIDFAIPASVPATRSGTNSGGRIEWWLQVSAEVPGVDYLVKYPVPVFDVPVSDATMSERSTSSDPKIDAAVATPPSHAEPSHPGISITYRSGGACEIHCAAGRNFSAALMFSVLAAALIAGTIFAERSHAPQPAVWVLAGFASILGFAALDSWLSSATIRADRNGLHCQRGWPLLQRNVDLSADSIDGVSSEISTQIGQTTFYRIMASHDKTNTTLASGIRGKVVADWIVRDLNSALNRS